MSWLIISTVCRVCESSRIFLFEKKMVSLFLCLSPTPTLYYSRRIYARHSRIHVLPLLFTVVSDTKNTMIVASVLGLLGGLAWKYGITQPRKREIDNFYANLEKGKTA